MSDNSALTMQHFETNKDVSEIQLIDKVNRMSENIEDDNDAIKTYRKEFVKDGQRMPRTTFPFLKAA